MLKLRPLNTTDADERFEDELIGIPSLGRNIDTRRRGKYVESKADSHIRYVITLRQSVPVMNTMTCGSMFSNASKLLGVSSTSLNRLMKFELAWDKAGECLREVEDCKEPLFNGAALDEIIKRLVLSEAIKEKLECIIKKKVPDEVEFEITTECVGQRLFAFYYVVFKNTPIDYMPEIQNYIRSKFHTNFIQSLCASINVWNNCDRDDKKCVEYLRNALILRRVVVLPYNLRPSLDKRKHPMTLLYQKLFQANIDVPLYENGRLDDFREHYRRIVQLVDSLLTKNHFSNTDIDTLDPLLTRLKTKQTGVIRSNLLKKRQDYSGRAAVVAMPYMPVNKIGLPKSMIVRQYRDLLVTECGFSPAKVLEQMKNPEFEDIAVRALERANVLQTVPLVMGRNPSLHKWSILAFLVVPNDDRAMQVTPLVCPAYNMDFDGDSAHEEPMFSVLAVYEASKLLMSDKNPILAKTGACTLCPEKDAIYGLYVCTVDSDRAGQHKGNFKTDKALKEALYSQKINIWDDVTVDRVGSGKAGVLAFQSCLPAKIVSRFGNIPVTQKVMKNYISAVQYRPTTQLDTILNSLVELGMRMSYIHSKSVSILKDLEPDEEFDSVTESIESEMESIYELNDLGFYEPDSYEHDFSLKLQKVIDTQSERIFNKVPDNMFKCMAVSGTRGNSSNLVQMFGSKGRIQKDVTSSFNIFIKNSMRSQLTPMELSIMAYGGRDGMISKSIKTADTGYFGRKLNHVAGSIVITENDCGTHEGLTIDFNEIRTYLVRETSTEDDNDKIDSDAEKIMAKFLKGRYYVSNGLKIADRDIDSIVKEHGQVKIRSPLFCKNPCCQKCYGIDVEIAQLPVVGTAAGLISMMSLSEPVTQMVLKEFQKGGVVEAASPFERLNNLLAVSDIRAKSKENSYPTYDPIAWAPGILKMEEYNSSQILLSIIPENKDDENRYDYKANRIVSNSVMFKIGQHVERGENLKVERGDCYVKEALDYCGIEAAQRIIMYSAYFLFKKHLDILPVHLEVLVSCITGYTPLFSDCKDVRYGKYYTYKMLRDLNEDYNIENYMVDIRGINKIVLGSPNFMEAMLMSDPRSAISEAITNCLIDLNDSPIVQLATGQKVAVGTGYNSNFIEERG